MGRRCTTALFACLALACASAPGEAPPGRSGAWGYVRLVPREGVTPGHEGAEAYGDRRLHEVRFVDYSRPGFAVVHGPGPAAGGRATVVIRSGAREPRLDPPYAAIGAGGSILVENASAEPHVLSVPGAGRIQRLAPGEQLEIPTQQAGEQPLFLLDVPAARATVFVAPGPFAIVSAAGRFELQGLAPGSGLLKVWHPRFPPGEHAVEFPPGQVVRVDLELGVEQIRGERASDGAP
jgi:hypothetical protein